MNQSRQKRLLLRLLLVLVLAAVAAWQARRDEGPHAPPTDGSDGAVEAAWRDHRSGIMLQAAGRVQRVLADDREGSRHQRFLLELASGHTVLVAHNIDLAPRVPLAVGDEVTLSGQFEWNEQGGVMHWTHHDPGGRRDGGWIEHAGRRYD